MQPHCALAHTRISTLSVKDVASLQTEVGKENILTGKYTYGYQEVKGHGVRGFLPPVAGGVGERAETERGCGRVMVIWMKSNWALSIVLEISL